MDNKVNKNMFLLIKTYLIGPYWTIRNNYMVASSATIVVCTPSLLAWGCSFFGTVPKSGKATGSPYSLIFSFSSSGIYGASSINWRIAVFASTKVVGSFKAQLNLCPCLCCSKIGVKPWYGWPSWRHKRRFKQSLASLSEFVELCCGIVENVCVQIRLNNAVMCGEQLFIIRVEAIDRKI